MRGLPRSSGAEQALAQWEQHCLAHLPVSASDSSVLLMHTLSVSRLWLTCQPRGTSGCSCGLLVQPSPAQTVRDIGELVMRSYLTPSAWTNTEPTMRCGNDEGVPRKMSPCPTRSGCAWQSREPEASDHSNVPKQGMQLRPPSVWESTSWLSRQDSSPR